MSYFSDNYLRLTFPLAEGERPGFREAQRGALFAIGAHFSGRNDAAIITMPTGAGKTAVLQASAFLLQAGRVLVLTPSRLVREQIAEDFQKLGVLKRLGAIPADLPEPRVTATASRITAPFNGKVSGNLMSLSPPYQASARTSNRCRSRLKIFLT